MYDVLALRHYVSYIERNHSANAVIMILACRIGPFVWLFKNKLKKLGARLLVNPDGHEWKRAKWNAAIKRYWKFSERLMVRHADMVVCDSVAIEEYIKSEYAFSSKTTQAQYSAPPESTVFYAEHFRELRNR